MSLIDKNPKRCLGKNINYMRCKRKTTEEFCYQHKRIKLTPPEVTDEMVKQEIAELKDEQGICYNCSEECNPCSQLCGRCMRQLNLRRLGWII
jgi:hypothetical protein